MEGLQVRIDLFQPFADGIEFLAATLLNEEEDELKEKVLDYADVRVKVSL